MAPTDEGLDDLGIDIPGDLFPKYDMRDVCKKLFLSIINGVKKREADMSSKKERDAKARASLLEQAAQVNPRDMLKAMVLETVAECKGKAKGDAGKGKFGKGKADATSGLKPPPGLSVDYAKAVVENGCNPACIVETGAESSKRKWTKKELAERKTNRSKPGNDQSPGAALGQNQGGKGKGPTKGKAKGKGKNAKGAENGQNGKSKGKGKGGK